LNAIGSTSVSGHSHIINYTSFHHGQNILITVPMRCDKT